MADLKTYERHAEDTVPIPGTIADVFAVIDDPMRISSHMSRRSWTIAQIERSTSAELWLVVGAAMAIAGLIPLLILAAMRATRRTPSPEQTDDEKALARDLLV